MEKTFSYIGPQIWQTIPNDLKALNYNRFKIHLKRYLISKY